MSIFSCSVHKKSACDYMSWWYKTVKKFRSEGTSGGTLVHIFPHSRITSDLGQHAKGLVHMSFDYLQKWRFHKLLCNLFQYLITPMMNFFLCVHPLFLFLQLRTIFSCFPAVYLRKDSCFVCMYFVQSSWLESIFSTSNSCT